jgi:hypothetical protein
MDSLKVFISSTWKDLGPERQLVEATLHRLRSVRFIGMEYFGARFDSTRDASITEVERADIYVGIFGHRYGSGITEQEYRRARALGLPCLIYLKNGWREPVDATDAEATRLEELRHELRGRHLVGFFDRPDDLVAKLTADLHNLLFDRLVVQGISQLRGDYDARIQRFLAEYLGTPEQPIPFGGREDQLEALDRWVRDPRSTPYAIVAGPAGRGKSALLVHWAQRLMHDTELCVIFFPISVRFRTNLAGVAFASIAARLAALHGEMAPGGIDTPPDVWRTLLVSYLRREPPDDRTFVLIIDGADESGDWTFGPDLLPAAPVQRLRVVVSARYLAGDSDARGWLERLGWTRQRIGTAFDVPPLTPTGLSGVLRNMSVPLEVLSGRADIVAELFRLSHGDPLLVNLYVADLWTKGEAVARLNPDDLATLEPGLDGYFQRWWEDQRVLWGAQQSPLREPTVNAVLDTLACALGPLLTSELLALVPSQSVTVWSLDDALHVLRRFVIGDGQSQGYAFSHPRLAYYFHARLSKAGHARSQEVRFVDWGLACLSELANGTRDATAIPTYVLQFLRPHMERAGTEPRALMAFASTSWIAAWDRLDKGSYTGFLNDLAHVRRIAEGEDDRCAREGAPAAFMADELRCALYASSIASIANDVPLEGLAQLIAKGVWSPAQAIAYGARIAQADRRMRTLLELTALSDVADRPLALAAAAAEARTLSDDHEGRLTLMEVIRGMATGTQSSARTAGLFAAGCQVAQQLPSPHDRWMFDQLRYATCTNDLPHAHAVAALRAIEPTLDPRAASWCRQEIQRRIAALTLEAKNTTGSSFSIDTFTLLHQSIDQTVDGQAAVDVMLQLAVEALAVAAQQQPGERRTILPLAFECIANMGDDDVARGMFPLYPLLSKEHARFAVEQIARIPSVERRVLAFSTLRERIELDTLPGLADDLIAFVANSPDGRDIDMHLSLVPDLAMLLPVGDLRRVLDVAGDKWSPVLFLDCLLRLVQSGRHPWSPADVIRRTLEMIEWEIPSSEQTDPLIAMIDWLLPSGGVNSRAPWRPMPEDCVLAPRVTRLLQLCAPPRDIVKASASRISQGCLSAYPVDSRHPLLDGVDVANAVPVTSTERRDALLDAWRRDSEDQVSEVVTALDKLFPRPELDETLQLLVTMYPSIPGEPLRQIAARVIDVAEATSHTIEGLPDVVRLVASPPLFPPTDDCLRALRALLQLDWRGDDGVWGLYRNEQLPDILREQLIIVSLTNHKKQRNERRTLESLLEAGLLVRPSGELLSLVLREAADMSRDWLATEAERVLSRISRHISPPFFGAWLKAHAQMSTPKRLKALTTLESARQVDRDTHWRQMVETLRSYGTPGERTLWLVNFAQCGPRSSHSDLLDVARSLDSDTSRFVALSAMAHVIDLPERRAILLEALVLARRVSSPSAVGYELVQLAIGTAADDTPLLSAAVATAVALPNKRFRSDAFGQLAPLLSADALADASQAFRTIGDGPARARAMVALISVITEPRHRDAAVRELVGAIRLLPLGHARHAAMLVVSPVMPVNLRWQLLEEAFAGGLGAATGFDHTELFDAIRRALPDAPARVLQLTLDWLAKQAPDAMRTRTVCSLLPYLPSWLVLPAVSLLASHCDDQLAAELAPNVVDSVFARAEKQGAYLSTETKSALNRIRVAKEHRRAWEDPPGVQLARETLIGAEPVITAGTDVNRVVAVRSFALHRERAMKARARLAEVTQEIGDVSLRVSTTRYLSAVAPERSLSLSIEACGGIGPAGHRAVITGNLALRFSEKDRYGLLQHALAAAYTEKEPLPRALAGAELARLAPALIRDALEVIFGAHDDESSARAVGSLTRHLDDEHAVIAVEALARIRNEERRAVMLIEVAATLGPASARAALAVAAGFRREVMRGRGLAALADQLPEDCRETALELLDHVTSDFVWMEALAALARRWPDTVDAGRAQRACHTVTAVGDEEYAADWCQRIASAWTASRLADLIEAVRSLRDVGLRTDVLCTIVRIRSDVPVEAILRAAREIDDNFHRGVLVGQYVSAREPWNARLAAEAIASARASGYRRRYVDALTAMCTIRIVPAVLNALLSEFSSRPALVSPSLRAISPLLTPTEARDVVRALGHCQAGLSSVERADLLLALGPRLDVAERPSLFVEMEKLTELLITQLLRDLLPLFDDALSTQSALRVAYDIESATLRTEALSGLIKILPVDDQRAVLSMFMRTGSGRQRVQKVIDVLPDIAPTLHRFVREYALGLMDEENRNTILRALDALSERSNRSGDDADTQEAQTDSLLEALLAECAAASPTAPVRSVHQPRARHALRLSQLVSQLRRRSTLVDRADEILFAFPSLSEIAKADLLGQLPEYLDEEQQVRVLALLDAPLAPALQRAAFDAVCRLEGVDHRRRALAALLPLFDRDMYPQLQAMWREALRAGAAQDRAAFLAQLHAYVPLLRSRGGDGALVECVRAINDAGSTWQ